jgi:hypothetical protein
MSAENAKPLETADGKLIPGLTLTHDMIIDRTIVLYGPSKTGKTIFVKTILQAVQGHIDQVLLVCPTEPSNRAYAGTIPQPLIHYRLHLADPAAKKDTPIKAAERFLQAIYDRQDMMAAIYTRANTLATLAALYARLPGAERRRGDSYIASLERKRRRATRAARARHAGAPGRADEQVKKVDERFEKMLVLVYKKFLTPHVARLHRLWRRLSEDERYSLEYLHFNPRLLLIFDDCAAQLKPFFNKEIFRKLFYQNRHSFITPVICCQDDTDLPTNLRKNAFISIFTTAIVASTNFDRASNKFPKTTRSYVAEIIPEVYGKPGSPGEFRKLAYIREDPRAQHFYHTTCDYPRTQLFGSGPLQELCGEVEAKGTTMDDTNPFFETFRV